MSDDQKSHLHASMAWVAVVMLLLTFMAGAWNTIETRRLNNDQEIHRAEQFKVIEAAIRKNERAIASVKATLEGK
jgi:ABC-type bacteriocin/lantibiotic exporter with double-glycine peptidase domain